jgi:large conductance mechanosensitive channel
MKKLWKEFKVFALSGSMLDLALGFVIGTAFATVVTSFTSHILEEMIAAGFGDKTFNQWIFTINGEKIHYGLFLNSLLDFFLFTIVLFLMLKLFITLGLGRNRDFQEQQCPYCLEFIPGHALVCKVCRSALVANMPDLATAEARAFKLRERHRLNLPIDLKEFDLPDLPIPKIRRRPATATAAAVPGAANPASPAAPHTPEHHEGHHPDHHESTP